MAYKATRNSYDDDDKESQKIRNDANNTRNVRNAADVAIASGNPYAMAAGAAVKGADKLTGGRASQAIGKGVSTANRITPGGNKIQELSNNVSESGISDTAGKAAAMKNRFSGNSGGDQESLPSSVEDKKVEVSSAGSSATAVSSDDSKKDKPKEDRVLDETPTDEKSESKSGFFGSVSTVVKVVVIAALPLILIGIIIMTIMIAIFGTMSNFDDAFGVSKISGEEVGGDTSTVTDKNKQEYYQRVNDVKLSNLSNGRDVSSVKLTAPFHVLNSYGANLKDENITTDMIQEVADAMFRDNEYDEEYYKENLVNKIIPKYIKNKSKTEIESIANEIIDYEKDYNSLIGKQDSTTSTTSQLSSASSSSSCTPTQVCTFDIKGYSISGKGNVSETITAKDVYVKLHQCDGKVMANEETVPFEKYILGVLYMNEDGASAEVIKARAVSLRSSVISMHAKGGSSTLKQEGSRWILSIPSCNNYTYCNPDKGCYKDSSGNVRSGTEGGTKIKDPMSSISNLKTYVDATAGEMLANSQGYVIYTNYNPTNITAQDGLSYQQLLVQSYGSSLGAANILKNSCKLSTSSCISTGEYASWRQTDGRWSRTPMGDSGRTLGQIGCLVTSISMLIVKSGVPTNITNFNPGTFVEYLNSHGGFSDGGNLNWSGPSKAAPSFKYAGSKTLSGKSREEKLSIISSIANQSGYYAVCEVKGNTGQHWVAIDSVTGSTVNMMDPSTNSTDMWAQYNWQNTSRIVYFKVS